MSNLDNYMFETYEVNRKGNDGFAKVTEYAAGDEIKIEILAGDGDAMHLTNAQFKMLQKAMEMYMRMNGGM